MRKTLTIGFILLASLFSKGQRLSGLPLFDNHTTQDYRSVPQNWGLVQDDRGKVFVANNAGLLTYDGNKWKLHDESFDNAVKCIQRIGDSLVIGSLNNLGTVASDSSGLLHLNSFNHLIPDSLQGYGEVRQVLNWDNRLVFRSDAQTMIFNGNHVDFLAPDNEVKQVLTYRKNLYLFLDEVGLKRYENGNLMPIPGGQQFIDNRPLITILVKDKHYLLTEQGDLIHYVLNKFGYEIRSEKLETALKKLTKGKTILDAYQIDESTLSVCVDGEGLMVIKDLSFVECQLTHDDGLIDEIVEGQWLAEDGSLWLALSDGIARVYLDYPVRTYDQRNGLEGTVEALEHFGEDLYAATNAGIYRREKGSKEFSEFAPLQSWDLTSANTTGGEKLIVATNNEIQEIKADGSMEVILPCYPWMVQSSSWDRDQVYVGLDPGATAVRWNGEGWNLSQEDYQMEEQINSVTEGLDKRLWFGTRSKRLFSTAPLRWFDDSVSYTEIIEHQSDSGYMDGPVTTALFNGELILGTTEGIRNPNLDYAIDTSFSIGNLSPHVHRLITDKSKKRLWAALYRDGGFWEVGYFDQSKQWNWRLFNPIAQDMIHAFEEDEDKRIWLGGPAGVFEVDLVADFQFDQTFNTTLRKVTLGEDSVIHFGNWQLPGGRFTNAQPEHTIPIFDYQQNGISFEYGALSFGIDEDITYSYWLEGNDQHWSKWTEEHKKEYTNLPPGDYIFKVKAKNIFETESKVAEYRFTILKPWFETTTYYISQTGFFLLLILLTFVLSRSGKADNVASIIAFITIITIFEYLIMTVEPIFQEFTGEIPVFNLLMNVLLAMSLVPLELFIKRTLKRYRHEK